MDDQAGKDSLRLDANHHARSRFMVMTGARVLYLGLLGAPTVRVLGAVTLYISLESRFSLRTAEEPWQLHEYAVVLPYVAHQLATIDKLIGVVLVEPETVNLECLSASAEQSELPRQLAEIADRVRSIYDGLQHGEARHILDDESFDAQVLGNLFAARGLDPRIHEIVRRISCAPSERWLGEDCAKSVSLSFSRFLHLFKQETGVPFRVFAAWKRARNLLHYVARQSNLTDIALEAGYPDATHFSHSIRKAYGLKPRDIFAGSRSLVVYRRS